MPKNEFYKMGCKYGTDIKDGASKKLTVHELYPMTMDNIYNGSDAEFTAELLPKIAEASECLKPKSAEVYVCYPKAMMKFSENMNSFENGAKDSFFDAKACKKAL